MLKVELVVSKKNLYLLDCWSITFTGWSTSCRPTKGTEGKL